MMAMARILRMAKVEKKMGKKRGLAQILKTRSVSRKKKGGAYSRARACAAFFVG